MTVREKIDVFDYSEQIMKALRRGILLNTNGDKFNSMVISWGHFGIIWGEPTFVVYVREHRYTKPQLDKTMEFTLSIPLDKPDPLISKVCGSLSGRDVDKVKEANLTLMEAETNHTPAVAEYPLTLECTVVSWGDGVLVGEDVNMSADERILTDGKVDLGKLQPIVFDAASMSYRSIGDIVGKAWGDGKKFTE